MNKTGKLEEIVDDQVKIDGQWFDASAVSKFLPKEGNIDVEYFEVGGKVTYLRKQGSFTPKGSGFTGKQGFSGKSKGYTGRGTSTNSPSIVKQCIDKSAVDIAMKFAYGSATECMEEISRIYNELKDKYYDELVSN